MKNFLSFLPKALTHPGSDVSALSKTFFHKNLAKSQEFESLTLKDNAKSFSYFLQQEQERSFSQTLQQTKNSFENSQLKSLTYAKTQKSFLDSQEYSKQAEQINNREDLELEVELLSKESSKAALKKEDETKEDETKQENWRLEKTLSQILFLLKKQFLAQGLTKKLSSKNENLSQLSRLEKQAQAITLLSKLQNKLVASEQTADIRNMLLEKTNAANNKKQNQSTKTSPLLLDSKAELQKTKDGKDSNQQSIKLAKLQVAGATHAAEIKNISKQLQNLLQTLSSQSQQSQALLATSNANSSSLVQAGGDAGSLVQASDAGSQSFKDLLQATEKLLNSFLQDKTFSPKEATNFLEWASRSLENTSGNKIAAKNSAQPLEYQLNSQPTKNKRLTTKPSLAAAQHTNKLNASTHAPQGLSKTATNFTGHAGNASHAVASAQNSGNSALNSALETLHKAESSSKEFEHGYDKNLAKNQGPSPSEKASLQGLFQHSAQKQNFDKASLNKSLNPLDKAALLAQIKGSLKTVIVGNKEALMVKLNPRHLGNISVFLKKEGNKVSLKLLVQNTHVKELVENNFNTLKQELAKEHVKLEQFQIDIEQESSQQPKEHAHKQFQKHNSLPHASGHVSGHTFNKAITQHELRSPVLINSDITKFWATA